MFSNHLFSKSVNIETVKNGAKFFLNERSAKIDINYKIKEIITEKHQDEIVFYIVTFTPKGFVLVSADDCVKPILGYSDENEYSQKNQPPAFNFYIIKRFKQQIYAAIKSKNSPDKSIIKEWEKFKVDLFSSHPRDYRYVSPLLSTTWGQAWPYNAHCPADTSAPDGYNDHVPVGCVATAMAQVLNYWEHPWHGLGNHSYTHSNYGLQSADFENTVYNFDNMYDSVLLYSVDVANLMYHCAVSVEMDFGPEGSGAWYWAEDSVPNALKDYFYFDSGTHEIVRSSHPISWSDRMRNNLDDHFPVIYGAIDNVVGPDNPGHAWVLDGYTTDDFFHCNWGWSGNHDGWFSIDDFSPGNGDTYDVQEHACVRTCPKEVHVNGTWTLPESPYIIDYNHFIDVGETLTIDPGVEIQFSGRYKFQVNGTLIAEGTPADSIHFDADNIVIGWKGVRIIDTNDTRADTSFFRYCSFKHGIAKMGMDLEETFGGALYCENSSAVKLDNCLFAWNFAAQSGGAICLMDTSNIVIKNTRIFDNTALSQGGGINCENSNLVLENVEFQSNRSFYTSGGGMFCKESDLLLSDVYFSYNSANFGAGLCCRTNSTASLNNVIFSCNTALCVGGAMISEFNTNIVMDSVEVRNNSAGGDAGGIFFHGGNQILTNCQIYDNESGENGGGFFCTVESNLTLSNSIMYRNEAANSGGAFYIENATGIIIDKVTIANHQATSGAGFYLDNSPLTITNSVVWNDLSEEADISLNNGSTVVANYCDLQGAADETWFQINCIDENPLFQSSDLDLYYYLWNDYPLPDGGKSPCIDAGDPSSSVDPDGTTTDIGYYYYHQEFTTLSGGNILGILSSVNSPYYINGDLLVPSGDQLTIEEGVSIIFNGHYKFEVNGSLLALGTDFNRINITAKDTLSGFKGLRFKNTTGQDSSIVTFCRITFGNAEGGYHSGNGGGLYFYSSNNVRIENCLINKNIAQGKGGGIYFGETGKPIFKNNIIRDNSSHVGGGFMCEYTNNELVIQNCLVENNSANYGGGVYLTSAHPVFKGTTFKNNYASKFGGGFYFYIFPQPTFDSSNRCNIYNNTAKLEGLDLFSDGSYSLDLDVFVDTFTVMQSSEYFAYPYSNYNFDVLNGYITQANANLYVSPTGSDENSGLNYGESLRTITYALKKINPEEARTPLTINLDDGTYSESGSGEIFPLNCRDNVDIKGENRNNTQIDGEDINQMLYGYYDNNFSFSRLTFKNGFGDEGGAGYFTYSSPEFTDLIFRNNQAEDNGGAISFYIDCNAYCNDILIDENDCTFYGGGLYSYQSDYILENSTITNNSSACGAGISINYNSNPTLENLNILFNNAVSGGGYQASGGGIYISSSDPEITNTEILTNSSTYQGGGVYISGGSPVFEDVKISGNTAGANGGGILAYNDDSAYFNQIEISHNSSQRGGGLYLYGSNNTGFYNTLVFNNTASDFSGGAFYLFNSDSKIINSTITSNSADLDDGGGIYNYNSTTEIINSIFYDNSPHEIFLYSGSIVAEYSLFGGGSGESWFGTGCIDADPSFVNPGSNNYRLAETSLCINAGKPDTTGLNFPEYDFYDNIRIVDGIIDMGISEYQGAFISAPENISIIITDEYVQINWDPVQGATEYKIYSSNNPYSEFTEDLSGTFAGNSWQTIIPESTTYYYVTALNFSKNSATKIYGKNKQHNRKSNCNPSISNREKFKKIIVKSNIK